MNQKEKECDPNYTIGNITVNDNDTIFIKAVTGSTINLLCNIAGSGKTKNCVEWKRNNNTIPRVDHVIRVKTTLHLGDLKMSDLGMYECTICDDDECTSAKSMKFNLEVEGNICTNKKEFKNNCPIWFRANSI
jgi:hypothetical protein